MLKRAHLMLLTTLSAMSLLAFPPINTNPNNIQPNQWTSQRSAALARGQALGLPILVVCGDLRTCGRCATWERQVINSAYWNSEFLPQYPMILVFLDRSGLSAATWESQTQSYRGANGSLDFPTVAIHAPNGQKRHQFMASGALALAQIFGARILTYTENYYNQDPGTIGFSVAAQSVNESAGTVEVIVKRTGGKKDQQTVTYNTVDDTASGDTHYISVNGSLTWADGDDSQKSFKVTIANDQRWTFPTERQFSVVLALSSGASATLGTAAQTITIVESSPATGMIGFSSANGEVWEGAAYTGTVTRTGGVTGKATIALAVDSGFVVTPETLSWADGDATSQTFVVSGLPTVTPAYDPYSFALELSLESGDVFIGQDTQLVRVHDSLVTKTLGQYVADELPDFSGMSSSGDEWFYNEASNTLRSAPLVGTESATLSWTAPSAGIFTFESEVEVEGMMPASLATGGNSGTRLSHTYLQIVVAGQTYPLDTHYSNNSVALSAGEAVAWLASGDGSTDPIVAHIRIYPWGNSEPVNNNSFAPTAGSKIQIEHIRQNHALVDLNWNNTTDERLDFYNAIYIGATTDRLAETLPTDLTTPIAPGINAVDDLNVIDLTNAQGWVYWRVDTRIDGDFGVAVAPGPLWSFNIIDLPVFYDDAPANGSAQNVFLRAGAALDFGADSATPVSYSATGLPQGLSINPATGLITGEARKAGSYPIVVRATNSEGSVERSVIVQAQALPAYIAGAKMDGVILHGATEPLSGIVNGALSFSASKTGKTTAKIDLAGQKSSLKGVWDAGTSAGVFKSRLTSKKGQVLTVEVGPDGILSGVLNGQTVFGRAINKALIPQFLGYYTTGFGTAALAVGALNNTPDGGSYLSLNISRAGKVKAAGVLADGTRVSSSVTLMIFNAPELAALGATVESGRSYAVAPINATLYRKRGGFRGIAWIDGGASPAPNDNNVWLGNALWSYPGKSPSLTADAFTAVPVGIFYGGELFFESTQPVGSYFTKNQNIGANFGSRQLQIRDYGITLPVNGTPKSLTVAKDNPNKVTLKASASTGIYSGKAQLPSGQAKPTKVSFKGMLIAFGPDRFGVGTALVPDTGSGNYRLKRSTPVVLYYPLG